MPPCKNIGAELRGFEIIYHFKAGMLIPRADFPDLEDSQPVKDFMAEIYREAGSKTVTDPKQLALEEIKERVQGNAIVHRDVLDWLLKICNRAIIGNFVQYHEYTKMLMLRR